MKIGDKIRDLRKEQGLSQVELASRAGIASAFLGQLERNLKSPTVKTLLKIAGALNISVGELFSGPVNDENIEKEAAIRHIRFQLNDFSNEELNEISMILESMVRFKQIVKK